MNPYLSPIQAKLRGPNAQFIGQKKYRNWVMVIRNMAPTGKVRLVVMLNPDYQDYYP